jgi:hypothetical protein
MDNDLLNEDLLNEDLLQNENAMIQSIIEKSLAEYISKHEEENEQEHDPEQQLNYEENEQENEQDTDIKKAIEESLNTQNERDKRIKEDESNMLKAINESYISNVAVQSDPEVISNDSIIEDQEFQLILEKILELEKKEKSDREYRDLIRQQDLDFEETLKKDIENEKAKEKEIQNLSKNIKVENIVDTESDSLVEEKPKSLEEIRALRLARLASKK